MAGETKEWEEEGKRYTNLQEPIRHTTSTAALSPFKRSPSHSLSHKDINILRNDPIRILRDLRLLIPEVVVDELR